jgi:hypothetical protein
MTDELTRKVMANLFDRSGRPAGPGRERGPRAEEKNAFQRRSLDPREEALLVEHIHAGDVLSCDALDALPGAKKSERKSEEKTMRKTMSLRDLAEQKR